MSLHEDILRASEELSDDQLVLLVKALVMWRTAPKTNWDQNILNFKLHSAIDECLEPVRFS